MLEAQGQKIAVFAVDCSFEDASRAGRATPWQPARPGVNFLRHDTVYQVSEEDMAALKSIAGKTRINFMRENSIATGFLKPDPEGVFFVGKNKYTTKTDVPCNPKDK